MTDIKTQEKIKRSLKFSILDGFFYSIRLGFGESFFQAYATFLKANNIELGLVGSLPQALGAISQFFTNKLIKIFKSRKLIVCLNVLFENLILIPIVLVFFIDRFSVLLFIIFLCVYWIFAQILTPAWSSWMGDLVNENERGRYFGKRNRICGIAAFVSFLLAGLLLQYFSKDKKTQYIGFVLIFAVAFIARFISLYFLTKKYEPEYKHYKELDFKYSDFIKQSKLTHFGLLVMYLCLMNFSVMTAGPFFTPYMLYDLKMDYLTFTIILASSLIVKNLFMPVWGKISDRYGTKKVITICGFFISIIPVLWLFSHNVIFLIIIQFISGFIWAGFELAGFNFIFDATSPKNRIACVSFYNVSNGISILFGGIIGGLIVKFNHIFWSKYLLVFLLSGVLRLIVAIVFISRLKEVREVEHISYKRLLLQIISTMATSGLVYNLIVLRKKKK